MSQVEQLEHNMVKITMEIPFGDFDKAVGKVYQRNKNKISVPGFRKGKAPRSVVERTYGKGVFYEDALNDILPGVYDAAVEELSLETASRPQVDIEKLEVGETVVVTATVAVKPEVTLGQYKNLDIVRDAVIVTEDDVDEDIKKEAERNGRTVEVTDRAAQMDDTVTINFTGYVDDEPFEGGEGSNYKLALGSHSFIDTFEDQIAGHVIGDAFDVNVTFPEDYQQKDLAGKPARFAVELTAISMRELPEIDDEFAQEVSEFDTLEEYKVDVRRRLTENKQKQSDSKYRQDILAKVVENAEMDIPEAMITDQCDQMINNFAQNLSQQGMSIDQYMEMTGSNANSLRNAVRPDALRQIKESLVLEAVAKAEGLEVTDEDITKEIDDMAAAYSMEADQVRAVMEMNGMDTLKESILSNKAMDALVQA